MTKFDRYKELLQFGNEVQWIAGCFLSPGYAAALVKLYNIVKAGHEVSSASFSMPYEFIMINGYTITYQEFMEWRAPIPEFVPDKAIVLFT